MYGCLQHGAYLALVRVASVLSSGAMKVAVLCDVADQDQVSSPGREWLKPDQ